jgi:hypothetical protein
VGWKGDAEVFLGGGKGERRLFLDKVRLREVGTQYCDCAYIFEDRYST